MRDRLVELIKQANKKCASTTKCEDCSAVDTGDQPDDCLKYNIADHLLANGVIVPPCKVGDSVYYRLHGVNRVYEGKVTNFIYNSESGRFGIHYDGGYGTYGKLVFLTREEAEQALKGDHQ